MTHFIQSTILDLRTGRETWRVFTTLGTLAFTVAILTKLF